MDFSFDIGLVDAMVKLCWDHVSGDALSHAADEIEIRAARNEVTGFQVHLRAQTDFVLTVDRTNWLHALGFQPRVRLAIDLELPGGAVEIYPVGYVEGDDRRQWAEYLERGGYMEVPAYRPQAVYVRLRVPADVPPGVYGGRVRAYTQVALQDEVLAWMGVVRLQVAPVRLPDPAQWSFHLDLWQHCTSIARYHHVPLWSEAHLALIDRYYASLAQLGQKAVTVIAAEIPWSGQRCYRDRSYPSYLYEHAVIDVERDEQGQLHYDYSRLDRLLALAARHGIDREIEIYGLLNIWVDEDFGFGRVAPDAPDAVRVRCYDRQTGRMTYLRRASELADFMRGLQDHMAQKGLLDRVRVAADEPSDMEAFRESLAFVQAAAPGFKYKAALNHFEFVEDAPPEIVDAVPNLVLTCQDPALTASLVQRLHERGGRMSWYICCWPPIPNTFLHSPLVESRLIGWLTFLLGLDGFLRWAYCLWPADPWQRVSWRAPYWSAGDMFFVLPGRDGAPVETLRYEALRAAVQDYELLQLAARTLAPDVARDLVDRAMAQILHIGSIADLARVGTARAADLYSLDPADYRSARDMVLDALAAAVG